MARWLVKAAAQGAISILPYHRELNTALQGRVTGTTALTRPRVEHKLARAARHLRHYRRVTGGRATPSSAFEVGTGWYPTVPVGLALSGVERVVTFDIRALCSAEHVRDLLAQLVALRHSGELEGLLPAVAADRLDALESCVDDTASDSRGLLAPLGVELVVGPRAAASAKAYGPFELIVSNNTLEHISGSGLHVLLADLYDLAAPGAVMDHFIDMRDHYATFDRRLSRLNFLRYPDPVWRVLNNRLQYQNRLRLPEYREIFEEAGFTVVDVRRIEGKDGEFDELRLAKRFRRFDRQEALVLYAWITATA